MRGEYLTAAAARGFPEVRLIHRRGIGVQRAIVRGVLSRHPAVEPFAEARRVGGDDRSPTTGFVLIRSLSAGGRRG